jgi:hypothetical protein
MMDINYWDGETIFLTDTTGAVHILEESGDRMEIIERRWEEARNV